MSIPRRVTNINKPNELPNVFIFKFLSFERNNLFIRKLQYKNILKTY